MTRLGLIAMSFLLPNLPFLLSSPAAWIRSLPLPMTLPLFPSGIGLTALAQTGLIPLWPPLVYALLELAALAALMLWYALSPTPPRPELALLLALLPFLLAWRSLLGYFLVLPVLAVYAAIPRLTFRSGLPQPLDVSSASPSTSLPPAAIHEAAFQSAAAPLEPAPTSASAVGCGRGTRRYTTGQRGSVRILVGSWRRCSWSSEGEPAVTVDIALHLHSKRVSDFRQQLGNIRSLVQVALGNAPPDPQGVVVGAVPIAVVPEH